MPYAATTIATAPFIAVVLPAVSHTVAAVPLLSPVAITLPPSLRDLLEKPAAFLASF